MPANDQPLRKLSVRLPTEELRRFKSRAAARGLSLQAATLAALEAWIAKPNADNPEATRSESLLGFLEDVDVWAERQHGRQLEQEHERRLTRIGNRSRRATP